MHRFIVMADKKIPIRKKKPVSHKRVATVLAMLVVAMTFTAAALLIMEGGSGASSPPSAMTIHLRELLKTRGPLQSDSWKDIIIYESGDLAGSVATLADGIFGEPTPNTVRPKANFHFVINSARSRNGADGQLDVSTTWREQKSGTPFAGWPDARYYHYSPYNNAVGICFIGSLHRKDISEAQRRTLSQLVRHLQEELRIPASKVWFQWELEPNKTPANAAQRAFAEEFRQSMK